MGVDSARPGAALLEGRYAVDQELARGGMGVVYRAVDRLSGSAIALKRSETDQKNEADRARSMLQREYQTLVSLRHPHIIEVFDFGVDELGPYYTMELLDGEDLRAKCPLPWREVCGYLRDVASSLALLHSRRLLHCDVSVVNIRLTSQGRAKLFDFGALASFGRNAVIAGAPPTIAPEVLEGEELDERVDLYALGGTAYFALTGRHAYRAKMIELLPTLWAQGPPAPPSSFAPDIPPELDELVLALLSLDRTLRPGSAAEVIDRLGAIAGLSPEEDQRVQHSYLFSAVVGRDAERAHLQTRLERAVSGRGGGVLIEGAPGTGKSFLLEDLLQSARLSGAAVLAVNARAHQGPFGVWTALLREAGARGRHASPTESTESALLELSESKPVVVAIDDLSEADPESLASIARLVSGARRRRLLVAAALDPSRARANRPGLQLVRVRCSALSLGPFDEAATSAFVTSLFGEVAAVPRLVKFLLNHTAGNPRACAEVVHHLIERGYIRYAEGTWILPDELPAEVAGGLDVGAIVNAALERRIEGWSPELRALALAISPHRRTLDIEACRLLTEGEAALEGKDLRRLLTDLVREGVLVEDRGAYAFGGSRFRALLYDRLDEAEKKRQHARIARALVASVGDDPRRGFEIGFHFLLAGQGRRARRFINRTIDEALNHTDALVESVPDLWMLVEHQRQMGDGDEDVMWLEAELFISGFYLDPTVHDRLADRLLPMLHRSVGIQLAERLAPFVGTHLAFVTGVLVAWVVSLVKRPFAIGRHSIEMAVLGFVGACASWSAGACFRLERHVHPRLIELLKLGRGFGRHNPFRLLYDLVHIGKHLVRGRFRQVRDGFEDQLERLPKVTGFTDSARHQYEAGLHFFQGRNELLRLDSTTLERAARIDALGARHDRLMAQYLRRTHYLYRGEVKAAKREEEQFDQMAAAFGSRWVADVMGVLEFTPYHLMGDVLGLKRTLRRIDQLVGIAPGLATHREIISAMYEAHRGRPDRALDIYAAIEDELAPFQNAMWATARGHQAECLNTLGRHAEALVLCEEARSHLTDADRSFVFTYQQLERESALALAGMGRMDEAIRTIDALIEECARYDNAMVRGLLHHDRARIACLDGDRVGFEWHLHAARAAFDSTENPVLGAKAQRLSAMGRAAGVLDGGAGSRTPSPDATCSALVRDARAEYVLEEIVEAVGAHTASLYLVQFGKAVLSARHGRPETSAVLHREIASLARTLDGEVGADRIERAIAGIPAELLSETIVVPLVTSEEGGVEQLVAMLLLGDCDRTGALSQLDLSALAAALGEDDDVTQVL